MPGPPSGSSLRPETFEPIELGQLLDGAISEGSGGPAAYYVVTEGVTWGKLNGEGVSDAGAVVGDTQEKLRESRRLLVGATCAYGNFYPFDVVDFRFSQALLALGDSEDSEKPFHDLKDQSLLAAVGAMRHKLDQRQHDYRVNRTRDLNRFIENDPSEIMGSVVDAGHRYRPRRDHIRGFALLHSVSFEGVGVKNGKMAAPIVRAVVAGEAGKLGLLPEGHAVKSLFVRAA
jgi:hypothetical protein